MAIIRLFVKYIYGWVCVCVRVCILRFKLAVVSPYCNYLYFNIKDLFLFLSEET